MMIDESDPTRGYAHFLVLAGRRPRPYRRLLWIALLVPFAIGAVEAAQQVHEEVQSWRHIRQR